MRVLRRVVGAIALFGVFAAQAEIWSLDSLVPGASTAGANARASSVAVMYDDAQNLRAVVVGMPNATVNGLTGAGLVQVFTPNFNGSWTLAQTIVGSPWPQGGVHFGETVAISGKNLFVGAPTFALVPNIPGAGQPNGEIVMFRDDGAAQPAFTAIATQLTGLDSRYFGRSIAAHGDFLAVSELNTTYVYRVVGDSLVLQAELPGVQASGYRVGLAIHAIDTTRYIVAIGSPTATTQFSTMRGRVQVYAQLIGSGAPTLVASLVPDASSQYAYFGTSVALDAEFLYVGAPAALPSPGVNHKGSVSLYRRNTAFGYDFKTRRYPGGGVDGDLCGFSVAANPHAVGRIAIGCPGHDANAGLARSYRVSPIIGLPGAYGMFETNHDWSTQAHGADKLGTNVAIDSNWLFASAPLHNFGWWSADHGTVAAYLRLP